MKNLVLIKQHSTVQLAHLYEHIFLSQVNKMLYDKGLFKWLDFSISGSTHEQGGVVVVDYQAYNEQAAEMIPVIKSFKTQINEQKVQTALQQIYAEEEYEVFISDQKKTLEELHSIASASWQDLDEIGAIDTRGLRRRAQPVYLTHDPAPQPTIVKISLELNQEFALDNRASVAVFATVARFILFSSAYNLATNTGSYNADIYSSNDGLRVTTELHFSGTPSLLDKESISSDILSSIEHIKKHGGIERLSKDLRSVSYLDNSHKAPDFERTLLESGVLLGSKGWAENASTEKILEIIENSRLVVSVSRKTPR